MQACYQRYVDAGIDVNAFDSTSAAADLEDLRVALGYNSLNLYAGAYGTTVGMAYLRDYGANVRSAVFDAVSPLPVQQFRERALLGGLAIEQLFGLCAADEACAETYPNLRDEFFAVIDRLNENPVPVQVYRQSDQQQYSAMLDGNLFVGAVFYNLASRGTLEELPFIIHSAFFSNYELVRLQLLPDYFTWDFLASGLHFAVQCNEELVHDTLPDLEASLTAIEPRLAPFFETELRLYDAVCARWQNAVADPQEIAAVSSDRPVLLVSGALDPLVPTSRADNALSTLINGIHVVIPNAGHAVTFTGEPCAASMVSSFFDSPDSPLDTTCTADIEPLAFTLFAQ